MLYQVSSLPHYFEDGVQKHGLRVAASAQLGLSILNCNIHPMSELVQGNGGPNILGLTSLQYGGWVQVGILRPLSGTHLIFSLYDMELGKGDKNCWPPHTPQTDTIALSGKFWEEGAQFSWPHSLTSFMLRLAGWGEVAWLKCIDSLSLKKISRFSLLTVLSLAIFTSDNFPRT